MLNNVFNWEEINEPSILPKEVVYSEILYFKLCSNLKLYIVS